MSAECGFLANVGKHLYVPVKQGHWGKIVRYECAECGELSTGDEGTVA